MTKQRRSRANLSSSWKTPGMRNAADGQAFGEPFTEDADFVALRGDYHQSQESIAVGHQGIFNTIYKDSRITYVLLQARTLTDNVILAHAR